LFHTINQVQEVVNNVRYSDWEFVVGTMGEGFYVQVRFVAPDNSVPGLTTIQSGRKWYISRHMTGMEVVQTCWMAVEKAVEHEAREQFKYRNVAIFQPHMNWDTVVQQAQQKVMRDPFPKAGPPTHVLDVGDLRHVNAID
jgi:hypothetical protein